MEPTPETRARLRSLPQVAVILETPEARALASAFPHTRIAEAIRQQIDYSRAALLRNEPAETAPGALAAQATATLREGDHQTRLHRVINATGIVIHTNMGRAPLTESAIDAVTQTARHYSNLEFNLKTGKRGSRASGAEASLTRLTGAEAAIIVNNNAAAVLLALSAIISFPLLAKEGLGEVGAPQNRAGHYNPNAGVTPNSQPEVILSRGELVEIGGSFRIPDVLRLSGAKLVEVGTTNRTHLRDYAEAITPQTRAILKVHASNYRITGYTKSVSLSELAPLANSHNLILMEDLGSGALIDLSAHDLPAEPTPQSSIAAGAHLVAFSADKLLGGPQAGIIVGRKPLIDQMQTHPFYRALRPDKLCLAALDATLFLYEQGPQTATNTIPVLQMLTTPDHVLKTRAQTLQQQLSTVPNITATIEPTQSYAGGGTLPELSLPSYAVRIEAAGISPTDLAAELRAGDPPIIGVLADNALRFDVRTLKDEELTIVSCAVDVSVNAQS